MKGEGKMTPEELMKTMVSLQLETEEDCRERLERDGFLKKEISYFFRKKVVACDGKCEKAWGLSGRPEEQLSDDEDDVVWLADDELGEAPEDPGTYERGYGKPEDLEEFPNKWCVRACERSALFGLDEEIVLPDWSKRVYNRKSREEENGT